MSAKKPPERGENTGNHGAHRSKHRRIRRRPSKRMRACTDHEPAAGHGDHSAKLVFGRSWYAELSVLFLLAITLFAFIAGTVWYPATVEHIALFSIGERVVYLPLPIFGLPMLVVVVYLVHRHFDRIYMIAEDHCEARKGRLSFLLTDTRIDYENVRGVEIDQCLTQRLFDVGDVKVGSSMHSEVELNMQGVRHPDLYRSIIETRIREHFSSLSSGVDSGMPQARRHGKGVLSVVNKAVID
jgi:hypothetical protein